MSRCAQSIDENDGVLTKSDKNPTRYTQQADYMGSLNLATALKTDKAEEFASKMEMTPGQVADPVAQK